MRDLIIGTIGSLIAALIWAAFKLLGDRMPYQSIGRARCRALRGLWEGTIKPQDKMKGVPNEIQITFDIQPGWWKRVRAKSTFASFNSDRGEVKNIYKGGFFHHRYLLFEYCKAVPEVTGFGAMLLELSADTLHLTGRVVGLSSHSQKMFFSTVTLTKKQKGLT